MMNEPTPHTTHTAATWTWLALAVLSVLSVAAAGVAHQHPASWRFWMTALVAALAWTKGLLLLRHYLEVQQAGPLFSRILHGFAALAPAALILAALREWLLH